MVRKIIETTVGRVLFNQAVPENVPFINQLMTKRVLKRKLSLTSSIEQISDRRQISWTASKKWVFFWAYKGGFVFQFRRFDHPSIKDRLY